LIALTALFLGLAAGTGLVLLRPARDGSAAPRRKKHFGALD
jgi:uncharacterized protein involved in exopolysaccharide biosynthesis